MYITYLSCETAERKTEPKEKLYSTMHIKNKLHLQKYVIEKQNNPRFWQPQSNYLPIAASQFQLVYLPDLSKDRDVKSTLNTN